MERGAVLLKSVVEDPILRGYHNKGATSLKYPRVVEDPILRGYHN